MEEREIGIKETGEEDKWAYKKEMGTEVKR